MKRIKTTIIKNDFVEMSFGGIIDIHRAFWIIRLAVFHKVIKIRVIKNRLIKELKRYRHGR